ncbi:MAG: hypothetical protein WCI49_14620 [Ferruginibacter sp.]
MSSVVKKIASFLPEQFVFGESFRAAQKIQDAFDASNDKMDFVQSYQEEKLTGIFKLAAQTPFYQYLGTAPDNISRLPFIDKETVLAAADKMIITKSGADYVTTGGTSGKPLGFFINKNRKGFEWFWMTHNWSKTGFKLSDYRAVLRNHRLEGKKFTVDPMLKEYQYDNFSLTPEYMDFIVSHINSKGLTFLHAYPSAAYIFANHLHKTGQQTTLKTFFCGSENILLRQKELIQSVLKYRMYSWYGHSEKLILAGEGSICENFHSNPFYGFTEIIDINDQPVTTPGEKGELVGTGFINTKMPFIRYRTGDFAEFVGNVCPQCGHIGVTFSNIKGRWHGDRIYKSDNSIITTTALNLHNGIYNYIQNIQYYQNEKGKLIVRVVPEKNFTAEVKEKLYKELMEKVGQGLAIEIMEVDKVEYSKINKFQLLIQKIKE